MNKEDIIAKTIASVIFLILSALTGLIFKDYYIGMFIGFLLGKIIYTVIWKEE